MSQADVSKRTDNTITSWEMSTSEVTVSSGSRQVVPGSQQLDFQETMVTHSDNNLASSYENQQNETEEEFPRYTTKELRDHFERTIEEAAAQKPIKIRIPKSELCTICRRRAYPMDALIVDKKKYHKSCFCCEHCRNKLSLGNYVSLHGHFYCQPHYKQLLKSKGIYDNGLRQHLYVESSGPNPHDDKPDWRYSLNSANSIDKPQGGENEMTKTVNESKSHCSKITVVWPPQGDPPKKTFKIEEDIQLTKPQWPPPDSSPISPKLQHRKAVPRSVL
ncbi:hypothetical protein CRENBAI_022497 [Crenichthys baileyi]|uniref:LIM zinc-binding domain-containing protein n=1 Tax=Crenichthys baileyi TaxID=28760 RepID=A0AAV9QYS5_9TELE